MERLRAARADVDAALGEGSRRAAEWKGPVDLAGRLDAVGRQLNAVRVQTTSGSLTARASTDAYSSIVRDVLRTMRELDAAGPTSALGAGGPTLTWRSSRRSRRPSGSASTSQPCSRHRLETRSRLPAPCGGMCSRPRRSTCSARTPAARSPPTSRRCCSARLASPSPQCATTSTTTTLGALQELSLDRMARRIGHADRVPASGWRPAPETNLTAAASNDLAAARADGFRDLGISLAVLLVVSGLGLALRWSITGPLREVSEGARNLSSGKLAFDIGYSGRDEIGHVASAFRDLHVTVERLAGEIREMAAAVRDNRLGHRADVAAFEGTWSQLLAGVNDTMAAFADVEGRRERAERELGDFFELSLDLLCIADLDGYFTRVNPAFERTLGYPSAELESRPYIEFVHPDDRQRTAEVFDSQTLGNDVIGFENRYVCSDGSVRWLQWSARPLPAEGLVYAVARDVTERRRSEDQQATLRRVATLVAEGASPAETFSAVAAEVGQLVGADVAVVFRYEPERAATFVGGWSAPRDPDPDRGTSRRHGHGCRRAGAGHASPRPCGTIRRPAGLDLGVLPELGSPIGSRRADHRRGAALGGPGRRLGRARVVAGRKRAGHRRLHRPARDRDRECAGAPGAARVRRRAGRAAAGGDAGRSGGAAGGGVRRGHRRGRAAARRRPHGHGPLRPGRHGHVVGWSTTGDDGALGVRVPLGGRNMVTLVFETGRPARIDDYSAAFGPAADLVRGFGTRAVGRRCRSASKAGCGGS